MDTLVHVGLTNAVLAAILALAVAGLTGFFRRRPAVVHGLWVLVLIKFLVPSFYPVEIPRWRMPANLEEHSKAIEGPQASASLSPEPIIPATPAKTLEQQPQDAAQADQPELIGNLALEAAEDPIPPALPRIQLSWEKWLGLAWLSGSLLLAMIALTRIIRFRRLLSHARPADRQLQSRLAYLAERLGVSAYPAISLVAAPIPPLLWALSRKPQLLLPDTLWERLSMEQQDTLLLHELAHLRRGDHWVRRLELAVLAIYWWHPVVWWAMRNLRETEEQCCDAWVVWALPMSGHSYAVALVETLEFLSQARPLLPLGASGIEPLRLLKRRLSMIVREQTPRAMPRWALGTVVVLGVALLPLLPIPAQQPGSDEGEDAASQAPPGGNQPAQPVLQPLPGLPSLQPDRSEQIEAARDRSN